jgi:serine/threonine-protein kinase
MGERAHDHAPAAPRSGDVVAGKYALVRPIGRGGMGLIFEAKHLRLQQSVAIKFMVPDLVSQADAVARFEREGRAASRLTSPYAARIFDVDATAEGLPYMVSEFLHGRDLRAELDERRRLPVEEATTYAIQVAAVMAEAHGLGIVHRDLKPSNLFLAQTRAGRIVKVVDFGISKMDACGEELDITTTGTTLGSPRYMSPEQVQAQDVDGRADIWSLGVILFRALGDAYPFEGDTPLALAVAMLSDKARDLREVAPEVPAAVAQAVARALARDADQRFPTMRDFAEALAPFAPPAMAALATSLTREAVPIDARVRESGPGARALSQLETLEAHATELDLPIDVEPTEQRTRGNWTQASSAESPAPRSRRRAWLVVAAAAVATAVVAVGVMHGAPSAPPVAAAVSSPPSPQPQPQPQPQPAESSTTVERLVVPTPEPLTHGTGTIVPTSPAASVKAPTSAPPRSPSPPPGRPPAPAPPAAGTTKNPHYL